MIQCITFFVSSHCMLVYLLSPPFHLFSFLLFRVIRVKPKEVTFMDKETHKQEVVPYGMCVWSTGVAPRPVILELMKKISEQKTGYVHVYVHACIYMYMYMHAGLHLEIYPGGDGVLKDVAGQRPLC